ncbi:MAG: 3,5-nucleoside bisphosphate phosphatase [Patescibacteria group bacterium]|nr:3,5-nucleoside bisphosphate phosphatase [Patescibacteria group bacterium]
MIDLHVHTNCSDGDYSPRELVNLAASRGIETISITDHDTIMAYNGDIFKTALNKGIQLIPGIELSTVDELSEEKIHVVGLNIDLENNKLLSICKELCQSRCESVIKTEKILLSLGFNLRTRKLLDMGSLITKFHIGHDVVSNPENYEKLIEVYNKIPLHSAFIEDYLIKGKPAFIKPENKLFTSKAVDIIKQIGGVAICAHPSFNVMHGFEFKSMKELIVRNKFDGVESINIQYNKNKGDVRFDMVNEFTDFANERGLLISGGSDYHSDNIDLWGNHSDIGLSNEEYQVDKLIVDNILSFRR